MAWKHKATDEFTAWLASLSESERAAFYIDLNLLELFGPVLGRPHVDTVTGSRYSNMKELRTGTLRSFFIFDPCRTAILLIGGDKRGGKWFYERMIALADKLYAVYLHETQGKDWNW